MLGSGCRVGLHALQQRASKPQRPRRRLRRLRSQQAHHMDLSRCWLHTHLMVRVHNLACMTWPHTVSGRTRYLRIPLTCIHNLCLVYRDAWRLLTCNMYCPGYTGLVHGLVYASMLVCCVVLPWVQVTSLATRRVAWVLQSCHTHQLGHNSHTVAVLGQARGQDRVRTLQRHPTRAQKPVQVYAQPMVCRR